MRSLLSLAVCAAAMAQTAAVEAPALGYVFDQRYGMLRPLLGVAGASRIGAPIELGLALALAEIAPAQDYALAVAVESGEVVLVRLDVASPSLAAIAGVTSGVTRVALSPRGSSAALIAPGKVQVIRGLPGHPAASGELDLAGLPAAGTLAVSDDGVILLAAAEAGVFTVTESAGARLMGRFGAVSAVRFLPGGRDALLADSSNNQILLVRDVGGAGETTVLAGERDGISQPVGVALAGRLLLVANASGTVAAVDLENGRAVEMPCDCRPSRLDPLRGQAIFRLNDFSGNAVFLLDAAAEPRIVFVPPDAEPVPPRARGSR